MEQNIEYRQKMIADYKEKSMPLLRYLPWFEQNKGRAASSIYNSEELGEQTLSFPVYNGTVMSFVREAAKNPMMNKNYRYVYTRNHIASHEDEVKLIKQCDWKQWDTLMGILSYYVLGGKTKGTLWNEAVRADIFYLVLSRMKDIIEYWDRPFEVDGNPEV